MPTNTSSCLCLFTVVIFAPKSGPVFDGVVDLVPLVMGRPGSYPFSLPSSYPTLFLTPSRALPSSHTLTLLTDFQLTPPMDLPSTHPLLLTYLPRTHTIAP